MAVMAVMLLVAHRRTGGTFRSCQPASDSVDSAAMPDDAPIGDSRLLGRLPSPTTLFAIVLAGLIVGVVLAKGLQDPDYFWHVTVGELIVSSGAVPDRDPFSFTWAGQPWTPHEWLGEVAMFLLVDRLGELGALIVFAAISGLIFALTATYLARLGLRTVAIAMACSLGAAILIPYVTLRPQVISWLIMAALIWLLLSLRPDRPWLLVALPLLFVAWANLHGLYVVGFGFVGLYVLFTVFGRTPMSSRWRLMLLAAIGCGLASMITPAGPVGILYPLRYLEGGDWGLANIQEWASPDFHEPAHWAFLVLIAGLMLNGGRGAPGWLVSLSVITTLMGLMALRNAPVAAVTSVPVLAMGIDARLRARWADRSSIPPRRARARRLMELTMATAVLVAGLLILVPREAEAGIRNNIEERFPVRAVDVLRREDPDVRVLAEYGWGGYVINRLFESGGRVFVDGRNDMYANAILEDYSAIRSAEAGWERLVDGYGVEALLLPPDAPIVRGFAQDAGWCAAYADYRQVLLLRKPCP